MSMNLDEEVAAMAVRIATIGNNVRRGAISDRTMMRHLRLAAGQVEREAAVLVARLNEAAVRSTVVDPLKGGFD